MTMHKAKRVNKRCEVCNALMVGVHYKQRFCLACSAARKRDKVRNYYAAQRAAEKAADPPPQRPRRAPADRRRGRTIRQIVRMATAEGLSYGQYVAKHGLH